MQLNRPQLWELKAAGNITATILFILLEDFILSFCHSVILSFCHGPKTLQTQEKNEPQDIFKTLVSQILILIPLYNIIICNTNDQLIANAYA